MVEEMSNAFRFGDISEKLSIFDSLECVMGRINWHNELGLKPDPRDIDLLCEYRRSGDLQKKWDRKLPPSGAKKLAVAKHVYRKKLELGNYEAALVQSSIDLKGWFKFKTIKTYHSRCNEHAKLLVRNENMIDDVYQLVETVEEQEAIEAVADKLGLPEDEVRSHYSSWKMTFPHRPEYYRSSEHYESLFGEKNP